MDPPTLPSATSSLLNTTKKQYRKFETNGVAQVRVRCGVVQLGCGVAQIRERCGSVRVRCGSDQGAVWLRWQRIGRPEFEP
jgi:hypothetical protein